jgi:hypothetical protein
MRLIIKLCCASALAMSLAACGGGDKGKDGKVASAEPAASSGPVKREPGLWKSDVKLVKFEMPGMPPEMKDGMAKMMDGASKMPAVCATKEQVEKEDLAQELSKGGAQGAQCDFSKKEVGSVINIEGVCKDKGGQEIKIAMTGTAEPKKTDVLMKVTGAAPTGKGEMVMEMQMTGTHQGPCA